HPWLGDRKPFVRLSPEDNAVFLNSESGQCLFLDEDLRCVLHREYGPLEKPGICQQFPHVRLEDGERTRLGVGLMCLYVFLDGNVDMYEKLKPYARSLGAAFQKVNFLRDVSADYLQLNRVYFPGVDFNRFTPEMKARIEEDIANDFRHAYLGIIQLPLKARFGVYLAYKYYLSLFRKIKRVQPQRILEERIRIPNYAKAWVATKAVIRTQLNIL
ncbi:MAG: squalene/phytoene synthase family protein, partial [Chitinophagaceae bacterium]|nr:squalene/phytoene synthase family protein [Chitinophagaceae bacterium]